MLILITIFAVIYTFFLPGFVLSFVFFWGKRLEVAERIALSVALSMATVPLIIFYTNFLGIRITVFTVLIQIMLIILIPLLILIYKKMKK
jgi:uncharacterized membrane protein